MFKKFPYFLIVLLLLNATNGQAQDGSSDSAYTSMDSARDGKDIFSDSYEDEDASDEEVRVQFDKINTTDKQPVAIREVNKNTVDKLHKDDDFWYANEAPQKEEIKEPKEESVLNKLAREKWFRNLLWILIVGGFIAVLIWFIVSSDIQLFKKASPAIIKQQEDDELINQNIFDIDYDAEIQKAMTNQNYRMAVRLLYLQTLKRLSERNIINYKQERTNSDYLMQLFNTSYYKDFFQLTRHFEYTWYGQFPIAPASFDVIKTDFSSFKQRFLS